MAYAQAFRSGNPALGANTFSGGRRLRRDDPGWHRQQDRLVTPHLARHRQRRVESRSCRPVVVDVRHGRWSRGFCRRDRHGLQADLGAADDTTLRRVGGTRAGRYLCRLRGLISRHRESGHLPDIRDARRALDGLPLGADPRHGELQIGCGCSNRGGSRSSISPAWSWASLE